MVVPDFFNGGALSEVGQLATSLGGVGAVARIQLLDHGKVDDVGGFILNTLPRNIEKDRFKTGFKIALITGHQPGYCC